MIKHFSIFILLTVMLVGFTSAQNKNLAKQAPIKINEPSVTSNQFTGQIGSSDSVGTVNYILVDYMANAFGPAIACLNPLAYDPYSDVVSVVHRAGDYGGGSGELWYNISTDRGQTWTRVSSINSGNSQIYARYPSMAISNPTKGDISQTLAAFSWPELTAGGAAFGWCGYGVDVPVGGGAAFSDILEDQSNYSSQIPNWTSDTDSYVFWESDNSVNASMRLFRTNDFATIEEIDPPEWADSVFASGGNITMGGVSFNGIQYFGCLGTFAPPDTLPQINGGWYPGYSTSTDDGATWSRFNVVDPRIVPGLEDFDQLYDYIVGDAFVSYSADINVDKDGYVHFALSLTDTNTANNAICEIYETANGWQGNVVYNGLIDHSFDNGPGLGQMGPSPYFAVDSSRTVFAMQWVNGLSAQMPWCDAYFSYRTMTGADSMWSTPVNLTNSDSINNDATHFAPMLATVDANHFMAFSFYDYVQGAHGPYSDTTQTTDFWIAAVPFSTTLSTGVSNELPVVHNYSLNQNYPNPFNPTTLIKYSIGERTNVTLKVYDMLGREVATLVNTTKDAGSYEVNFDASRFASGVYIYKIQAGNFTQSRKMMLLK